MCPYLIQNDLQGPYLKRKDLTKKPGRWAGLLCNCSVPGVSRICLWESRSQAMFMRVCGVELSWSIFAFCLSLGLSATSPNERSFHCIQFNVSADSEKLERAI